MQLDEPISSPCGGSNDPKNILSSLLSVEEYPLLTGGITQTSEIWKVFEESACYLGFEFICKTILGTSDKKAASFRVPEQGRGGGKCFVEVPASSAIDQFAVNARRKKWIDIILKTAGTGLPEDDIAAALIIYLVKHNPNSLPVVGRACNILSLTTNDQMDPQTSAAMWHEANLPLRGQRVSIKQYIYAYILDYFSRKTHRGIDKPLCSTYSWKGHGR